MTPTSTRCLISSREETRLETRYLPHPGPGELVVRLALAGLCGTDLFKLSTGRFSDGTVLGHEIVGRVEATGPGSAPRIGQRVAVPHHLACGSCALCRAGSETSCPTFKINGLGPGGFSSFIRVDARLASSIAFEIPDAVPDEAACLLEPTACVVRSIRRSGLDLASPEPAAILGGGSMGLLHLLVLRALGYPGEILVSEPRSERRSIASRWGGRGVEPDALPGQVASHCFDTVGGGRALTAGTGCLRAGGTLVLFAHAPAESREAVDLNRLFHRELRLVATYSSGREDQRRAHRLLLDGFDPSGLITHRLPFDRFDEAVELARTHRALKVALEPPA